MTALPELRILDVGHGNAALIRGERVAVVDCPRATTLQDTLRNLNLTVVHEVLVSHADADHIMGLTGLLQDPAFRVEQVYVNPDALKETLAWKEFRLALQDSRTRNEGLPKVTSLTTDHPGSIQLGQNVQLTVLTPSGVDALAPAGTKDLKGRSVDSNGASVVVRLLYDSKPIALLAGDMNRLTLDRLNSGGADATAPILIFPHHGGTPGTGDVNDFTKRVLEKVCPDIVVFSIGRGKHRTPRPDIVETLRATRPMCVVACTQLSEHCADSNIELKFDHIKEISAGLEAKHSCAGTLVFRLDQPLEGHLGLLEHRSFVEGSLPKALCMKRPN